MTDEPLPALEPCPLCCSKSVSRSIGKHSDGSDWPYIECEDCGCLAEMEAWNRRRPAGSNEDRMREALKPFAALLDVSNGYENSKDDEVVRSCGTLGRDYAFITVRDLRRAKAALSPAGSVREAELERALEKIGTWAKAYPVSVFHEPDFKRAHEVLAAAGISLDAISASNMRHVIMQVQEIVERALRGTGGGE